MVVSSGEVKSSDSDSKQTILGPAGHSAELGEAVALAASPFSGTSFRRIALVLVRFIHVARCAVNANHGLRFASSNGMTRSTSLVESRI